MKKITAWILKIERGYREITFRFNDITDAETFLRAWMFHKDSDDDDGAKNDRYSIIPVIETADETLDDIPVQ